MDFPATTQIALRQEGPWLHVTLNRPEARNAMSRQMVEELLGVADQLEDTREIRGVILRGAGGHFCAGGDIKDMAEARAKAAAEGPAAWQRFNRAFGTLLQRWDALPQVTVAVLEGAVMGGGFGLACISDVAIAHRDAQFAMPETSLGILPAQIAPFVVHRVGLTQARRLTLLGSRIDGTEARAVGIVHFTEDSPAAIDARLAEVLKQLKRCAPNANANTKRLLHLAGSVPLGSALDEAAVMFSQAVGGSEGAEGTMAFVQKRPAAWAAD
ncbi:MAG: enoyl-CoA hydratase/isomerase family protein [Pseudomonadota bacterium]